MLRTDHVDAQYGDGLDAALLQALPRATIDEAANARVVVTLTGDLREELPILFLRLRESAVRYQRSIVELAFGASALAIGRRRSRCRFDRARPTSSPRRSATARCPSTSSSRQGELDRARELIGETATGVVFVVGRPNIAESADVIEHAIRRLATQFPHGEVPAGASSRQRHGRARHGPRTATSSGTRLRRREHRS